MKGRIKREDLDHLLRLVEAGLPKGIASHHADQNDADAGLSFAQDIFDPEHGLWNANHAFWMDKLKSDTDGAWTNAQYAAAANIINAAEYQHVIFSDFANALTRGLSQDSHGHAHFTAHHAAPSFFDETVDLVDASSGRMRHVKLAAVLDHVRGPDQSDERNGAASNPDPASDALRNGRDIAISSKHVNLGELTGSRARDAGYVPFNETRGELFAQCGLSTLLPYAGWDDFRDRNHLSDDLIADLKAAYPDGFGSLDLWVGGLAEKPAVGDLGPTIAAAVSAEIDLHKASAHPYLDLLTGTHLASEISTQSWSDIVARNTDAAHFADHMHWSADQAILHGGHSTIYGTHGDDVLIGTYGNDVLIGGAGNDYLDGRHGADVMIGGPGNDTYVVDNVKDHVIEKADGGTDTILTVLDSFVLR